MTDVTRQNIEVLRETAREYLRTQLRDRAPNDLVFEARFEEKPLDGEGPAVVFSFDIQFAGCNTAGGGPVSTPTRSERHYVVVGETEPNYFPGYGLDADDAYSIHVGTRFMLVMELGLADPNDEPTAAREALRQALSTFAANAADAEEQLAGLFRSGGRFVAVYRLRLNGEQVYCLTGDFPTGFYRLTQFPPQVVLRLHLGKLIRAESDDAGD